MFAVGSFVADVDSFYLGAVEFVESVDYACSYSYFVDADYLWVVFVDGVYDESGRSHCVEFLILGRG